MTPRSILHSLKLFRRGFGGYGKQMLLMVGLGFLSGFLEALGINAVIPLFSVIANGEQKATDVISRTIEKIFIFAHWEPNIINFLILICSLFILKMIVLALFNYITVRITAEYERATRANLFRATLLANWKHLLKEKIGYLEQTLTTDISRGSALLRHISGTILLITGATMYIIVAINISALITLLTIITGLIIFMILKPFFYKTRVLAAQQANLTREVAHLVNEHMLGSKMIKSLNIESAVIDKANQYFIKLRDAAIKSSMLSSLNNSLIEPIGILFISVVFALSFNLPGFNFISFAVIIYLIQKIFSYIQIAQTRFQTISELAPHLAHSIHYMEEATKNVETQVGTNSFYYKNSIEFSNVSFGYDASNKILNNINLHIEKGSMIGLIGPSGSGKTTIADLLLRLFTPDAGSIQIDGASIETIRLTEWRQRIGYVSQDVFLINDTIRNNIKFYNEKLTDEAILDAARAANLSTFIERQQNGMEKIIGERGSLLSGGERQRLVLARVLARKPDILLLDEATSALDNEAELAIKHALDNLRGKVTIIIIAHRLSTIKSCDLIFVLDKGKIVEHGKPEALLSNTKSYFYRLSNLHLNSEL